MYEVCRKEQRTDVKKTTKNIANMMDKKYQNLLFLSWQF